MPKSRISLTIEDGLLERIDKEADERSQNRSQLVEDIVRQYFKRKVISTAVVLCGDEDNKTLELYEGKPVLSHILDQLELEGINRVILLVGKNKEEIEPHFGSQYNNIALEYIEEKQPAGTGKALKKVGEKIDKTFLTVNGHVISGVDIQDMLKTHKDNNNLATMSLTTVEDPSSYGVAKLKGSSIQGFKEKPEKGEEPSRLINAGTYIFEPQIFEVLKDFKELNELFEHLASRNELTGYIYGGEWKDIQKSSKG